MGLRGIIIFAWKQDGELTEQELFLSCFVRVHSLCRLSGSLLWSVPWEVNHISHVSSYLDISLNVQASYIGLSAMFAAAYMWSSALFTIISFGPRGGHWYSLRCHDTILLRYLSPKFGGGHPELPPPPLSWFHGGLGWARRLSLKHQLWGEWQLHGQLPTRRRSMLSGHHQISFFPWLWRSLITFTLSLMVFFLQVIRDLQHTEVPHVHQCISMSLQGVLCSPPALPCDWSWQASATPPSQAPRLEELLIFLGDLSSSLDVKL